MSSSPSPVLIKVFSDGIGVFDSVITKKLGRFGHSHYSVGC